MYHAYIHHVTSFDSLFMNVKDIQLQKRKFSTRTGEQVIGEVHLNTSMHDSPKLQFFFTSFVRVVPIKDSILISMNSQ